MTHHRARRSPARILGVLGILLCSTFGIASSATRAAAADGSAASSVTKSNTVSRTFLDAGQTTVVDSRKVTLSVNQTTNLRSLQLIHVSWTGALPTGGVVADQNSDLAQNEEYPFALFECRGDDSSATPLSPDTCWTQYGDERFSYGYNNYPAWRSDSAATPAQRAAFVNAPDASTLPKECTNTLAGTTNQRWVPFVGADKTNYPGGPFGCAGAPPEASAANYSSLALPSNETFGVTDAKGTGAANFDIFTSEDHASLGCSSTVACSLVAVPIEGISCDPAGADLPADQQPDSAGVAEATKSCEATGKFPVGETLPPGQTGTAAVDGSLWWSPSNWANRISVPLTFAPADNVCSLNSSAAPVDVYGSELMIQATTQWAPDFCLNKKLFDLNHVQTPEPQARNLLSVDNIEAAYTSEPPDTPYPQPTVNAPVAVTGFGIAYDVDDNNQHSVGTLNLDARLLAKLLTESYPDIPDLRSSYPALASNPLNITQDPEFEALNPNIPQTVADGAATLLMVNTDSDVVQALTSYIDADPEARAWLNGTPDPWGMVVNPNYKNIALPVNNWPLLDSFEPTDIYKPGKNDCLAADPVPYLPLVAAPTARLFSIGQDMQFALSQSQTTCVLPSPIPGSLAGAKLVADGRQATGRRIMFGIVSLGDAAREGLTLASLETHTDASAPAKFTDATGRTFVAPTTASLRAAAQTLRADTATGTWPIKYPLLRSTTADEQAYPGTMVVYAAIPTKGLPKGDAKDYGELLTFAAGKGQHAGTAQGDLPAGFLPMTSANGLGQLVNYTSASATAVTAQAGALPSLTGATTTPSGSTSAPSTAPSSAPVSPAPTTGTTSGDGGGGGAVTGGGGAGTTGTGDTGATGGGAATTAPTGAATSPATSPAKSASTSPDSTAPITPLASASAVAATTPGLHSGLAGAALPLLLGIALAAGASATIIRLRARGSRIE